MMRRRNPGFHGLGSGPSELQVCGNGMDFSLFVGQCITKEIIVLRLLVERCNRWVIF